MTTDVKDLVTALRQKSRGERDLAGDRWGDWLCDHAAVVIEAQAKEIVRLVAERNARNADAVRCAGEKAFVMGRASAIERERAEEWRKRREAEGDRDVANAAALTLRVERDALKAENDRLREALAPFADFSEKIDADAEDFPDDEEVDVTFGAFLFVQWPIRYFRQARAALHPTHKGEL